MGEHIHDHDCTCGCEHDDGPHFITLTLDDGAEIKCVIIAIFEAGEHDYIALLPTEGPEYENGEVYLYRYSENENEEPVLENIESDEEYEIVADAFDELLDAEEYDETIGDEE
ncbi:MAG: DUF1292 domain-containing protein [Eubacterium sp.]